MVNEEKSIFKLTDKQIEEMKLKYRSDELEAKRIKEQAKKEIAKEIFKDLENYNYNIGKDNDGSLCIMKNGWIKLKNKWEKYGQSPLPKSKDLRKGLEP